MGDFLGSFLDGLPKGCDGCIAVGFGKLYPLGFGQACITVRFTLTPFFGQPGGVRTAAGDFNGDGIADLVVGIGPGGPTHVKVFNCTTQAELFSVDPFEASFTSGVYVAAGDINGDGVADLVITPDEGGGPRVRAFTGNGFNQIADFFGIDDTNFRGGAARPLAK